MKGAGFGWTCLSGTRATAWRTYWKSRYLIAESGSGKRNRKKVFDRFYQAESSLKKEGGGTGIGLALTSDLVKLMHGSIKLKSKEGEGSTFRVLIPLGKRHLDENEYSIWRSPQNRKEHTSGFNAGPSQ